MRLFLAATTTLGIALAGFYVSSPSASAQGAVLGQAGLVQWEKVRLVLSEPDRGSHPCTVIDVRGDFLGCRTESAGIGQSGYTRWYNVKLIIRIDRPGQD